MTDDTLLHRLVHRTWVRRGKPTSQAFKPTAKDEGRLSLYDGDRIAAEGAWRHYTEEQGFSSVGVISVTPTECHGAGVRVIADGRPYPEQVTVDFDGLSRKAIQTAASALSMAARERGWQYGPIGI